MRSMTAYGRAKKKTVDGRFVVLEIHSVNRKLLDIAVQLPREFLFLDGEIRKWVASHVQRGQVTVRLSCEEGQDPVASASLLQKAREYWKEVASHLSLDPKEINLSFLLDRMKESSSIIPSDEIQKTIREVFVEALTLFLSMRDQEGSYLKQEFVRRLSQVQSSLERLKQGIESVEEKSLNRFLEKIKSLSLPLEEDRLLKEAGAYVEKSDVTEEILRLFSHIQQSMHLIEKKEGEVGKTLEFLLQEMHRESNTLNRKISDIALGKEILLLHSEIEKMKEQVQNIE